MSQSLQSVELLNGNVPVKVDFVHTKKAALILRSINHKLRQQIIKLLDESQKMTVTEIYVKLRLEQSVASQHLAILRRAGIVSTTRDGKFIYYSVNYQRLAEVVRFVESLVG
ncbi:MAG: metalloregulator ArsR/SmtB family transcription factor [Bacteroidetes bacterium]|jgi:DNA-binding transcriptional ArsR family regulator|nr:metalloregulator ArsR/SmtB family transcription factor [Bacteroidota bacterium]